MLGMVHCFLAILAFQAGRVQTDNSMTLGEIARANSAAVAAIQSLDLDLRFFESKGSGPSVETDHVIYRIQGDRERMILDRLTMPTTEEGDRMGYRDESHGLDGFKSIIGYDPSRPPQLGEITLSRAFGTLGPRFVGPRRPTSIPRLQLLFEVAFAKDAWTLRELIASSHAKLLAGPSTSPRRCHEIEVNRPGVAFKISVDPAANFMIRRVETILNPGTHSKPSSFLEVESFRDSGDGVFLPTLISGEEYEADGGTVKIRRECKIVSCNKPLPSDLLEPTFPDWLPVIDQRSGKIHYWGPGDKPRLTFGSAEEQREWWLPRVAKAKAYRARSARRFPWSLAMGGITVVIGVGAVLLNRARARRP